jgi:hypothetical protein
MSGSRACHQIGDTSQELYIIHAIGGKTSRCGIGVLIERLAEGGGLKGALVSIDASPRTLQSRGRFDWLDGERPTMPAAYA